MNKLTIEKDYLKFVFDFKRFTREYAKEHNVSLDKSMDYINDQLNKYSC